MNILTLTEELSTENKKSTARAITIVESDPSRSEELLKLIHKKNGRAYRIGITGPPGAGKSTVTNQLAKNYRSKNLSVGIIAVDPTSPYTGGALLGDRVRMSDIGRDPKIFIRSMATRGSLGGLSTKAIDAADVLDAAGYDIIIIETVGVGQSELEIVQAADTTIVILVPESGDAVQAMKAGLMEIADFFVVNKSDRPGADQAMNALRTILMMRNHDEKSWMPNIIKAVATEDKGIIEIANEIERHKDYLIANELFSSNRKMKLNRRVKEIVENKLIEQLWNHSNINLSQILLENNFSENNSPYNLADNILNKFIAHLNQRK